MRSLLRLHGRDHREGGADPIPGWADVLRFNKDNQGQDDGSLEITARGEGATSDAAITITALAENGGTGDINMFSDGPFLVQSADGISLTDTSGITEQISSGGFLFLLTNGSTYQIRDHLGSPLVTYSG